MKSTWKHGLAAVVTALAGLGACLTAEAKSLYVIADINSSPTPINTYDIQAAPSYLVFQATQGVPDLAGGAVGLAIDTDSKKLAVTYEGSNTIQLLDATNFNVLGTTTADSASNLAGIVFDQGKKKLYTIDRTTNHLYVYSWNAATDTLTLDGGAYISLPNVASAYGLALDEKRGRLYIGDANTTTVRYFDTATWAEAGSYNQTLSGQTVMGIAVDTARNIVYTGNAYQPYGSRGELVKYDLNTGTESFYTLPGADPNGSSGDNIVGVAVDEDTGDVYVTTGNQGSGGTDTLIVFDSALHVLKNDFGDIGSPTGLVVPRASVSYNPLNFSKTAAETVATGDDLSYSLCYDNTANAETSLTNAVITDTLPSGVSFVSATGSPTASEGTVTWNIGNVAAGAPQICYSLVVHVTAAEGSTLLNSATIKSDQTPPTTQTATTTVTAPSSQPVSVGSQGRGGAFTPIDLLAGLGLAGVALVRRRKGAARALSLGAALLLVSLTLAGPRAYADDRGWFAGGGLGLSVGNYNASDLEQAMASKGYATTATLNDKHLGWKLFGGYEFNQYVAVEAGYVDLGKISSTVNGNIKPAEAQAFVNAVAAAHPYSVSGFTLGAAGHLPLWHGLGLTGRLGMLRWAGDVDSSTTPGGTNTTSHQRGFDLTCGAGVEYRFAGHYTVELGWDRYDTDRNHPDLFAVSGAYRF